MVEARGFSRLNFRASVITIFEYAALRCSNSRLAGTPELHVKRACLRQRREGRSNYSIRRIHKIYMLHRTKKHDSMSMSAEPALKHSVTMMGACSADRLEVGGQEHGHQCKTG